MLIGILALVTALAISAVAIYYSVAGLVAIFAAAAIPIMIMGGVLEISKLVTAVWLHRNWHIATWWLKTYLSTAVVVLMFITSLGIFGFLSKAHVEQTTSAQQSTAQIEQLSEKIDYNLGVVSDAENKIDDLQSSGSTVETNIREQIQLAQQRIDTAYERLQPAIQAQRDTIAQQSQLYQRQLDSIDEDLELLKTYITNDEIKKAQAIVGTDVDGDYGPKTAEAFREYQQRQETKKAELVAKIESASTDNQVIQQARQEIERLQRRAEQQIADSTQTIQQLRNRLNNNTSNNIETLIEQQNTRIQQASSTIEDLTAQRFELESSYRQLEAEVGPLRYIAEFIYGEEAGRDLLEKAVQWVIILIIFVFDPLAVLLLIASQYTFEHVQRQRQLTIKEPKGSNNDAGSNVGDETDGTDVVDSVYDNIDTDDDVDVTQAKRTTDETDVSGLTDNEKTIEALEDELGEFVENVPTQEFMNEREALYNEKEQDEEFVNKKTQWKADHPDETLKHYKKLYVHGVINSLPWE